MRSFLNYLNREDAIAAIGTISMITAIIFEGTVFYSKPETAVSDIHAQFGLSFSFVRIDPD